MSIAEVLSVLVKVFVGILVVLATVERPSWLACSAPSSIAVRLPRYQLPVASGVVACGVVMYHPQATGLSGTFKPSV